VIPAAVRRVVLERDGHRCRWCGVVEGVDLHHILYRSQGGRNDRLNLRPGLRRIAVVSDSVGMAIRQLRTGEADPDGEAREYSAGPYVRLRWRVGRQEYVERYKRNADGSLFRQVPKRHRVIDWEEARRLYEDGLSLPRVARRLGVDQGTLCRRLYVAGVSMRSSKDYAATFEVDTARRLYESGMGLYAVAREVGAENVTRLSRELRKAGVQIRRPGRPTGSRNQEAYETEFKRAREEVARRSHGRCEARTPRCTLVAIHVHHRQLRSQGGTNALGNLLHTCLQCHVYIHDHPKLSYERGWLERGAVVGPA
jgi:5-methylcytosine-specific restriction endonuclease McrA